MIVLESDLISNTVITADDNKTICLCGSDSAKVIETQPGFCSISATDMANIVSTITPIINQAISDALGNYKYIVFSN